MFVIEAVAANIDYGGEGDVCFFMCRWNAGQSAEVSYDRRAGDVVVNLQPVKLLIVRKTEDELIDDAVDTECSAEELHRRVCRIVKDEVVGVKFG